jgi:plasmid maintenance system antidote protein VapI
MDAMAVRKWLEQQGMRVSCLAKLAEVDAAHLGRVVSGKRPMTRMMGRHLASVIRHHPTPTHNSAPTP